MAIASQGENETSKKTRMRPLESIVVLDLTRFLPGAVATMQLGSFGAEVIKIERPPCGDPARSLEGASWLFEETNRGKKSVAIDLRDTRGKSIFVKLVTTADILIESFRPNVMTRLGLNYEKLSEENPRLIYAALSGYGRSGPYAEMAGHDLNYVGMSGLLDLISGANGELSIPAIQLADLAVGSPQIVTGILLALVEREKSGRGQRVDVSFARTMGSLLTLPLAELCERGRPSRRGSELLSGAYACYNLYQAKDGRWLALGSVESKFWVNACRELQCAEFTNNQFAQEPRQSEMKRKLAAIFATRSSDEWFLLLKDKDCCLTPVRTLAEAVSEGQIEIDQPGATLSRTAGVIARTPAPLIGEHSVDILERCGVTRSELQTLQEANVIQTTCRN
jgi:crotonobetainyl-CoA:carnitine CoA-transferase CaiB-like acyl-CoA transferase